MSRVSCLTVPGGHALLVGVGGSECSLIRLASFVLDYDVKQIALSKSYTIVEWQEDLRIILKLLGQVKNPICSYL